MTQDTRKDPRAKVLTMTVRYKSATLDEFIEHHSHDVSRGGMFIKTPSPFPAGTLLKFEVKIAAEQRVMQGVGRVVWKREASDANDVRPAGMGVKFIKIDDDSRKVIDQLVDARGEAQSNFEDGAAAEPAAAARGSSPPQKETPVATPLMPSAVAAPRTARKSTMIGLGAMGSTPSPAPVQPKAESTDAFFPKTELDMPAPEDRTVMKQAAELLQDALREAGGSLEDVGTPLAPAAGRPSESKRPVAVEAEKPAAAAEPAPKPAPKPAPEPARPAADAARAAMAATAPATRSVAVNVPKARVAPAQVSPAASADGGGGKFVLAFAAVAVVAGIVYFASQKEPPAPPPAEPAAEQAAPPPVEATPPPAPEPAAVAPPPAPEPAPSAAPSAAPEPSAAASAAPSAPAAKALAPVVPAPKPVAAPRPVVRQQPRPKAVPTEPSEPATPPAAAEPPAEKPAPAEKPPAAEKPAPAPKPVPAPKPAPAKKPADGDNPY